MNLLLWLQFLTILLAPLYILRTSIFIPFINFSYPTTLLELLIFVNVLVFLFLIFKNNISLNQLRTKYDGIILFLLLITFIEIFYSYDLLGGLGIYKAYFLEPVLFYYSLNFSLKKYKSAGKKMIIFSLIGSGFWLCSLGYLQKLTGLFSLAPNELLLGRITGVYNSANALVLFVAPLTYLILYLLFKEKSFIKKTGYLALFIFFFMTVYLSRSRGGLVAEMFGLLVFFYGLICLKFNNLKKYWYVFPLIIFLTGGFYLVHLYSTYNFIPDAFGQPYTKGDTLQIRFFIWAGTINLLKEHLIFGAGLNGFKTLYSNQYMLTQYKEHFQYPHNLILTFWTETGILGLSAFLLLIVRTVKLILEKLRSVPDPIFGLSLMAVISYILVHGLVDVPYFKNDLSLQFWTFLALINYWVSFKESN